LTFSENSILFGTTPLKAQNDKECWKYGGHAFWLRLCPRTTWLVLAGDLVRMDTECFFFNIWFGMVQNQKKLIDTH